MKEKFFKGENELLKAVLAEFTSYENIPLNKIIKNAVISKGTSTITINRLSTYYYLNLPTKM